MLGTGGSSWHRGKSKENTLMSKEEGGGEREMKVTPRSSGTGPLKCHSEFSIEIGTNSGSPGAIKILTFTVINRSSKSLL